MHAIRVVGAARVGIATHPTRAGRSDYGASPSGTTPGGRTPQEVRPTGRHDGPPRQEGSRHHHRRGLALLRTHVLGGAGHGCRVLYHGRAAAPFVVARNT